MTRFLSALLLALAAAGCGSGSPARDQDYYTSGSRDADQRAEQRIARTDANRGPDAQAKKSLFDRLGGEKGVQDIVDDFVARALADPRVNWERKGVTTAGLLGLRKKSEEWKPDPASVEAMKKHIVQFLNVATGGPARYQGRDMKEVHQGMRVENSEFDAAVGDLKTTLDKFRVGVDEQKELLAIVESTRPQIVEKR